MSFQAYPESAGKVVCELLFELFACPTHGQGLSIEFCDLESLEVAGSYGDVLVAHEQMVVDVEAYLTRYCEEDRLTWSVCSSCCRHDDERGVRC